MLKKFQFHRQIYQIKWIRRKFSDIFNEVIKFLLPTPSVMLCVRTTGKNLICAIKKKRSILCIYEAKYTVRKI